MNVKREIVRTQKLFIKNATLTHNMDSLINCVIVNVNDCVHFCGRFS